MNLSNNTRHAGVHWLTSLAVIITLFFSAPPRAQAFDLVVPNLALYDNEGNFIGFNPILYLGQVYSIGAFVGNQGTTSSPSATLTFRRSVNDWISIEDTIISTVSVSPKNPNQSSEKNVNVQAYSIPGTYWIGACVSSPAG